jgi:hypothetical protein
MLKPFDMCQTLTIENDDFVCEVNPKIALEMAVQSLKKSQDHDASKLHSRLALELIEAVLIAVNTSVNGVQP